MQINGYISIDIKENLSQYMKTSICSIKINMKLGTGFFIKLPIPSKEKPMYGIMTNNHVLNSECIKPGNSFSVRTNIHQWNVILNENDFIFTSELLDVTFIQLTNSSFIESSVIYYLEPSFERYKEEDKIFIFQYPKGNLSSAEGNIRSLSGFNYFHSASTEGGSSGSPLLNYETKVIGIHKAGIEQEKKNIATDINIIYYALRTLYNKKYINKIEKARAPARELSEDEISELKKRGLKETKYPNIYKCPYLKNSSQILFFYRTNHAWYFTTQNKNEFNYKKFKIYHWNLINAYEPLEKAISHSDVKLEHHHKLIMMWLKLSELKYM